MNVNESTRYCVIPGAASAGLTWRTVGERLPITVLEAPDDDDVRSMAATLAPRVEELPRPLVLVGASLGAMVALELMRVVSVDAYVPIASGFGITIGEELLQRVASDPPDLLEKLALASVVDPHDDRLVEQVREDFEARGQRVLLRHLTALDNYRPDAPAEPPPTVVIWGERDRGIPAEDHIDLAVRCRGVLAPVPAAGNMPFIERPDETVRWLRIAARLAEGANGAT